MRLIVNALNSFGVCLIVLGVSFSILSSVHGAAVLGGNCPLKEGACNNRCPKAVPECDVINGDCSCFKK
ncbi:MAG: hypothetical protein K9M08_16725 [Pirellula sp.]|nr:hypothetical protein [Pirellula sp.]